MDGEFLFEKGPMKDEWGYFWNGWIEEIQPYPWFGLCYFGKTF